MKPTKISVEKAKSPLKSTPSRSKRPSEFEHAARLSKTPKLRFSPTAWAKLLFLRDYGDTEVGGFGITALGDLLYVEDVALVQQTCISISVAFNDESVADFFDRQVDAGLNIQQFARLWLHTHPGTCPQPSLVDEETFSRVFGKNDWAVIFILAEGGESYARLQYSVGPGASMLLPVAVDYSRPFTASDYGLWEEEYLANVREPEPLLVEQKPDSLVQEPTLSGLFGHQRNTTPFFDEFEPGFEEDLWEEFLEFQEARHGE